MTGQDRLFFADIGEEQTLFDFEPVRPAEGSPMATCTACGGPVSGWPPVLCARCVKAGYEPQTLL